MGGETVTEEEKRREEKRREEKVCMYVCTPSVMGLGGSGTVLMVCT